MIKRPRSVTVTCWIFIAIGSMALLTSTLPPVDATAAQQIADFKAQHSFQFAFIYVGPILAVLCGVLMLLGFGWARCLFHAWFGHVVISNVIASPLRLLLPGLLFAVAVYYLYRPAASVFFRSSRRPVMTPNESQTPAA